MIEIHKDSYKILKTAGQTVPLESQPRLFKYSNVTTWSLWCVYVFYQLYFAWSVQRHAPNLLWQMWVALFAELSLSFQEAVLALNTILALFCAQRVSRRPCYQLLGGSAPTVDVFICSCREPIDVILDTVKAAAVQDWPSRQFRVFLLDDGRDERLREAIERLDANSSKRNGPRIVYLSRVVKRGVKSYFKAGNLQFGLEESGRYGNSELVASLDADMIPQRDWLRRIVPHLILDSQVALACPPQVGAG